MLICSCIEIIAKSESKTLASRNLHVRNIDSKKYGVGSGSTDNNKLDSIEDKQAQELDIR